MKNYKKFMAQVNERIEKKSGRRQSRNDGGMMSRRQQDDAVSNDDYIEVIASYIATIRKTAQRLKAKNNEA